MNSLSPSFNEFAPNNDVQQAGTRAFDASGLEGNEFQPSHRVRTRWHPKGRKPQVNRKAYRGKNAVFS